MGARLALVVGILAVSSASILFRFTSAPPLVVATYRLVVASLILGGVSAGGLRQLLDLNLKERGLLLLSGFFLAVHFGSWFESLRHTTIAASTFIVDSAPVITLVVSWLLLGERARMIGVVGVGVSMAGLLTIFAGHRGSFAVGPSIYGDFMAFLGALGLSGYLIAGRIVRRKMGTTPYASTVYGVSGIFLLFLAIVNGDPITGYPAGEYLVFLLLAIIPSCIGHTLYNYTLRYLKAYVVNMGFLGEPVIATILAYLIFREVPSPQTVMGGALILAGMYLTIMYEKS